ncbi:MAG: hypothetical protein ACYTG6_14455 [Planctomycetota bacterium]|jgi:hypothetical protein
MNVTRKLLDRAGERGQEISRHVLKQMAVAVVDDNEKGGPEQERMLGQVIGMALVCSRLTAGAEAIAQMMEEDFPENSNAADAVRSAFEHAGTLAVEEVAEIREKLRKGDQR